MYKLAIVGSRHLNYQHVDYKELIKLTDVFERNYKKLCIVSGGARGIDTLAEAFAKSRSSSFVVFPADWDKHGHAAGPIRNKEIEDFCDGCLAIWDLKSKGTAHTISLFQASNKPVLIYSPRINPTQINLSLGVG